MSSLADKPTLSILRYHATLGPVAGQPQLPPFNFRAFVNIVRKSHNQFYQRLAPNEEGNYVDVFLTYHANMKNQMDKLRGMENLIRVEKRDPTLNDGDAQEADFWLAAVNGAVQLPNPQQVPVIPGGGAQHGVQLHQVPQQAYPHQAAPQQVICPQQAVPQAILPHAVPQQVIPQQQIVSKQVIPQQQAALQQVVPQQHAAQQVVAQPGVSQQHAPQAPTSKRTKPPPVPSGSSRGSTQSTSTSGGGKGKKSVKRKNEKVEGAEKKLKLNSQVEPETIEDSDDDENTSAINSLNTYLHF